MDHHQTSSHSKDSIHSKRDHRANTSSSNYCPTINATAATKKTIQTIDSTKHKNSLMSTITSHTTNSSKRGKKKTTMSLTTHCQGCSCCLIISSYNKNLSRRCVFGAFLPPVCLKRHIQFSKRNQLQINNKKNSLLLLTNKTIRCTFPLIQHILPRK